MTRPIVTVSALVFSGLVTALGAIDGFFDHRALWIRYTATNNELRTLQGKLEYLIAGGVDKITETQIDELFDELMHILQETNAFWVQLRKETKEPVAGPAHSQ